MKRKVHLLNETTMSWFWIIFSPLCIKIQPSMKRGTPTQWFHPLPCKFASHKHLLQKGSQTATTTSISWGEHDWRSQSRALGQALKLELLQWMIFSSGRGQTFVLILLNTLKAFSGIGYNDIWFLAQLRMTGWLLTQIQIPKRTVSMTSHREIFSHFSLVSSFVVSHFNTCIQWLLGIQSNIVRWDAILPFFHYTQAQACYQADSRKLASGWRTCSWICILGWKQMWWGEHFEKQPLCCFFWLTVTQ